MHQLLGRPLGRLLLRQLQRNPARTCQFGTTAALWKKDREFGSVGHVDYTDKYSQKLKRLADRQGTTVEELIAQTKEKEDTQRKVKLARREHLDKVSHTSERGYASANTPVDDDVESTPGLSVRKDSSPVKPLSKIINFQRLFDNPHTPEQVTALWHAYHASRSGGTGQGYLCATIPVDVYNKMVSVATPYSNFLLPLPRDSAQIDESERGSSQPAEFFFLQWGFHGSPPDPTKLDDPFASHTPSNNPQTSTILFTSLLEYKTHNSFATPHLVITHYTDLAETHGLVLLRGELTPLAGQVGAKDAHYLLSQQDAQLLALGVQKFYLWDEDGHERKALLKAFHENRGQFKWEDLLRLSEFSV